jgi:hypothetical protein
MNRTLMRFAIVTAVLAALVALYGAAQTADRTWVFWALVGVAALAVVAPRILALAANVRKRYDAYPRLRATEGRLRDVIANVRKDAAALRLRIAVLENERDRTRARFDSEKDHMRSLNRARHRIAVAETHRARRLYIELLKRALTHTLYWPLDMRFSSEQMSEAAADGKVDVVAARSAGRDWPIYAQTMVGMQRLENVQNCVEAVLRDKVEGDFIETGVWRGGCVIFMRGLLQAYGDDQRSVYVADSFEGLPAPDAEAYPADEGDDTYTKTQLAIPLHVVQRNFKMYGLLDGRVRFLKGWFKDTLPTLVGKTWSIIRLDGDMYESTMDALVNLYPGLSIGGYVIIDDYALASCRQAVDDYRKAHGIVDPIETVDWTGAYWQRAS